jgi:hypothetical protein
MVCSDSVGTVERALAPLSTCHAYITHLPLPYPAAPTCPTLDVFAALKRWKDIARLATHCLVALLDNSSTTDMS